MTTYKRTISAEWDFRAENTKEYTHCYHSYPAMMIPQIVRKLILEYKPSGKFSLILDPYMGSGTTLVEASIYGVNSIGIDLNPLACLLGKTKTTHFNESILNEQFHFIEKKIQEYDADSITYDFTRITNPSFWYDENELNKLSYLNQIILEELPERNCIDFFKVILSEIVRDISYTRKGEFKRFKMNDNALINFKPDTFKIFVDKYQRNILGLRDFNEKSNGTNTIVHKSNSSDEHFLSLIPQGEVDMVITSPPYGDSKTTVAYGQFSRWSNEWFDCDNAKNLDNILMGGKKSKNPLYETLSIENDLKNIKEIDENRYYDVVSFLNDYWCSIKKVSKTLRKGGVICYVVGNRNVKGIQIQLDYFTIEMFEKLGFKHIDTIVRSIPNKRMPSKTSPTNKSGIKVDTMSNEYIVIMEKMVE